MILRYITRIKVETNFHSEGVKIIGQEETSLKNIFEKKSIMEQKLGTIM